MNGAFKHGRRYRHDRHHLRREAGAALVTTLFIVLVLLILGVSAARSALGDEKSARSERDRHLAFQAAESALSDAERDIEGGSDPASARAALFAHDNALGFVEGCGGRQGPNLGLCLPQVAPPAWQRAGLDEQDAGAARCVEYGSFTGARMPVAKGSLPARLPRYIIELMPYARAGENASERRGNFYRITAIGFGSRDATRVVLQSFYLKAAAAES